jgi:ankyrin repeat protein
LFVCLFVCFFFFFFFFLKKQNFPGERTLDENRALCRPLHRAVLKGDWPAAEAFLNEHPDCVRAPITNEKATALHIAVIAQRTTFIEELLRLMVTTREDLELQTTYGYTALHHAAQSGIVRIAEKLVDHNHRLLLIPDANDQGDMPLNVAACLGHANMISYLLSRTRLECLTPEKRTALLHLTIYNDLYGN